MNVLRAFRPVQPRWLPTCCVARGRQFWATMTGPLSGTQAISVKFGKELAVGRCPAN